MAGRQPRRFCDAPRDIIVAHLGILPRKPRFAGWFFGRLRLTPLRAAVILSIPPQRHDGSSGQFRAEATPVKPPNIDHPASADPQGSADPSSLFSRLFGPANAPLLQVRAPGRVNLIGEHTDYNDGPVCPIAIDRHTTLFFRPRNDATVRLHSVAFNDTIAFSVAGEVPKSPPAWSLYPRGVAEALRRKGLLTHGLDGVLTSNVPLGGGLSSSAALEMAVGLALLTANNATLDRVDLALAGQWAEHHYPGMPCGIMDQFISAMGKAGHALLLDCRDRTFEHVPLDDPNLRIVISNSNVKHSLVTGEYANRRQQCEAAVAALHGKFPAMTSLRDASLNNLSDTQSNMDPVTFRRARHVITEIQRTTDFASAVRCRDYPLCGQLMFASHTSLRDDYQVSCPELDALVDIARTVPGVYGARMTGGGFGGCIVALTTADAVTPLIACIDAEYPKFSTRAATSFATVASAGVHVVS
jgi:galactokinase